MEEQQILDLYWIRDEQAIRETAAKYGRYCYRIAHNILENRQGAEERVQALIRELFPPWELSTAVEGKETAPMPHRAASPRRRRRGLPSMWITAAMR